MRRAVVRVNPDPQGLLRLEQVTAVREALRASGVGVVGADLSRTPPGRRELEVLLDGEDVDDLRGRAVAAVAAELAGAGITTTPDAGAVTFTSAGTMADALGIFRAFGVRGEVRQAPGSDDDSVTFLLQPDALEGVSESRLLTALQSGLNRDVSLVSERNG